MVGCKICGLDRIGSDGVGWDGWDSRAGRDRMDGWDRMDSWDR